MFKRLGAFLGFCTLVWVRTERGMDLILVWRDPWGDWRGRDNKHFPWIVLDPDGAIIVYGRIEGNGSGWREWPHNRRHIVFGEER